MQMLNFPTFDTLFPTSNALGFDDTWKRVLSSFETATKNMPGYPPYNIRKLDENKYVIELAIAGFSINDVEITLLNDGILTVTGRIKSADDKNKDNFIYKGIAERMFSRSFSLSDTVEIKNANMINGLLKIWLENIIPEAKKPKKIKIQNGEEASSPSPASEKKFLTEGEKKVSLLEALAKDKNSDVRSGVASNPSTPVGLLEALAKDEDWQVRQNVASNPSTPMRVLEALAKDKEENVRQNVTSNLSTP